VSGKGWITLLRDNFCNILKPADQEIFFKILTFQRLKGFLSIWHHPCPLKEQEQRQRGQQGQTESNRGMLACPGGWV
jgi:hypothetical protein